MPDIDTLSRPLRRVLAEWLSRLVDRLLNFQYQLRYGLIRMISNSVAETIEEQLHRPFSDKAPRSRYEEDDYLEYQDTHSMPRLAYGSPQPPYTGTLTEKWLGFLSHSAQVCFQWFSKPWVTPVMAGCVTLASLLLLVR